MEEDFRAALTSAASVTALVPASRINWLSHPQGAAKPYIVMTTISDADGFTMQGPDGLSEGRVQVDCYAPTALAVKQVSRAAKNVLNGYTGGGFDLIMHVGSRDSREGGTNEAERLFRVSMDFKTAWRA
jgi:hypothetical protein